MNKGRQKTILTQGMHRGFQRGINAAKIGDQAALRSMLHAVIGGATHNKMYNYQTGRTIIDVDTSKKIETVFGYFNITPEQIWDN